MHAEFLQDECNNIWFTYAKNIHFRWVKEDLTDNILAQMGV